MKLILASLATLALAACASTAQRPSSSTYGCMRFVVDEKLPSGLPDKRAHCLAAGLVARYCSIGEAYLAGMATELADLFGPGNAEWADWRADRHGVACAQGAHDDAAIAECCSKRGY